MLELYSGIGGMHYALKGESGRVPTRAAGTGTSEEALGARSLTSSPLSHASDGKRQQTRTMRARVGVLLPSVTSNNQAELYFLASDDSGSIDMYRGSDA